MFSFPVMKRAVDPALANSQSRKYQFDGKRLSASPAVQRAQITSESRDTFNRSTPHQSQGGSANSSIFAAHKSAVRFGSRETDRQVERILQKMPEVDVQRLSRYFRILMTSNQTPIGYTCFGDKPMSFVEFDEVRDERLMMLNRTWKKYARQLPSDSLHIRLQRGAGTPSIFVINKKAFLKTVSDHLDKFQAKLGKDMTPKKLLDDILSDESNILHGKLDTSEELYGLLFGLTLEDAQHADLSMEERMRIIDERLFPLSDFGDTDTRNHTQVILPQALLINGRSPGSFSLVRQWKDQRDYLQRIVNIPDERQFLRVMLRQWADANTYSYTPSWRRSGMERDPVADSAPTSGASEPTDRLSEAELMRMYRVEAERWNEEETAYAPD